MKKVLIFTIALILLLTFTITSNAESRLKEFEEALKGKWQYIGVFKNYVYFLEYPSIDNTNPYNVDRLGSKYSIYLTEDGTGQIYLNFDGRYKNNTNDEYSDWLYGIITFNSEKNIMTINTINSVDSNYTYLYKRIE